VITSRFDTDTTPEPLGEGRWSLALDDGWWVGAGPNGGYVGACLLRAMEATVADPARTCRSLTVHYLVPPRPGPAVVEVAVERSGRSLSSVSARMLQDERVVALALGAFSRERRGPAFVDLAMPDVDPPELCGPGPFEPESRVEVPSLADRFEHRWAAGDRPLSGGDAAESSGWIRLADGHPVDPAALFAYADAWMPVFLSRVRGPFGITTVDLTLHVRELPPEPYDDWCLVHFRSEASLDGFCEESGEIWTRDGTLLAQSRQLAALVEVR